MKGIVLAGGAGSRLYPSTIACSKQILTIYDKPMIYYPISVLMMAGIRDILIISTARDFEMFKNLLDDGSKLGVNFSFKIQKEPRGIADAFIVGEDFIVGERVCLILGDNVFYGSGLEKSLSRAAKLESGALVFGYYVKNPKDFGVVEFSETGKVLSIEEKPKNPKSNYMIPGLYFYDSNVLDIAKSIKPSARGELEITEVNNEYLKRNKLSVELLETGVAWFDTGSHEALLAASNFVSGVQNMQNIYIGCLEEIAYKRGYISKEELLKLAEPAKKTAYGEHLLKLVENECGPKIEEGIFC